MSKKDNNKASHHADRGGVDCPCRGGRSSQAMRRGDARQRVRMPTAGVAFCRLHHRPGWLSVSGAFVTRSRWFDPLARGTLTRRPGHPCAWQRTQSIDIQLGSRSVGMLGAFRLSGVRSGVTIAFPATRRHARLKAHLSAGVVRALRQGLPACPRRFPLVALRQVLEVAGILRHILHHAATLHLRYIRLIDRALLQ